MSKVYIALGTNLGARVEHMRAAVRFLEGLSVKPIETSFLYETPPWGVLDQPPFLNAIAKVVNYIRKHQRIHCCFFFTLSYQGVLCKYGHHLAI